jgi:hypothetical protein
MNILKASSWTAASLPTIVFLYACVPHTVQPTPTGALCRTEATSPGVAVRPSRLSTSSIKLERASTRRCMASQTRKSLTDSAARRRGVDVALKTDKIESAGKTQAVMITNLQAASVPVEGSEQSRLLYHKFAVLTGGMW